MGEFELIERHLAPLAGEGAEGLGDDAARAFDRVLTKDLLVEGRHFLKTDPLDLVARKALRVNISDLVAKGARPEGYLLGLVWPKRLGEAAFARFASGLRADQEAFGLTLLGGDTTGGDALVISITMIGTPLSSVPILRKGGQPGDLLVVTGTIGDGLLGLEAATGAPPADDAAALAYRLPEPPVWALPVIAAHARAGLDVSDGLLADAGHIARRSGVRLVIDANAVPLSERGEGCRQRMAELVAAGDDYQSLFLIRPGDRDAILSAVPPGRRLSIIGCAEAPGREGPAVALLDEAGHPLAVDRVGWDHFSSL